MQRPSRALREVHNKLFQRTTNIIDCNRVQRKSVLGLALQSCRNYDVLPWQSFSPAPTKFLTSMINNYLSQCFRNLKSLKIFPKNFACLSGNQRIELQNPLARAIGRDFLCTLWQFTTEHLLELLWVPDLIESTESAKQQVW